MVWLLFSFKGRRRSLLRAIGSAPSFGGGPRTGAALKYVKRALFSGRSRRRKVLIVITKERSYDKVTIPAATLRRAGVEIITIGTGRAANTAQLRQMAGKRTGAMFTSSFRTLFSIAKVVKQKACTGKKTTNQNEFQALHKYICYIYLFICNISILKLLILVMWRFCVVLSVN